MSVFFLNETQYFLFFYVMGNLFGCVFMVNIINFEISSLVSENFSILDIELKLLFY